MDGPEDTNAEKLTASERSSAVHRKPRFLVIGAGRRGTAYASAVRRERLSAIIAAVAEPVRSTRISFGKKYVWEDGPPREDQAFESWQHFLDYETNRREAEAAGKKVYAGIDGIIVCTQDHTHKEILQAFGPLKLHVLCEKPISTSLQDCQDIYVSLGANSPERIFSTGHVLRYSPHNMLLRRLLLEDRAIGRSYRSSTQSQLVGSTSHTLMCEATGERSPLRLHRSFASLVMTSTSYCGYSATGRTLANRRTCPAWFPQLATCHSSPSIENQRQPKVPPIASRALTNGTAIGVPRSCTSRSSTTRESETGRYASSSQT
ncbi:hypothetical protein QC762_0014210 [Podospora pseudocomata]|uniref:Gfo/Idh/MocA-like oxidoreductase N-terminal domain-containing protein n=1 Tax=Podospora pseudocomata TaxID=2093779 RepID=A0ABR0GW50_9PEZI|nr:hypothetical protein QC762_0014210 [Podospora pseudocomata]